MGNISYKPLIDDMTWSYSRIEAFNDCPYRFFLKYIKKYSETDKFYSSYGSFIHKLLEKYYKGELSKEEMLTTFLSDFSKEVRGVRPKGATVQKYIDSGCEYLESFTPFPYKMIDVEKKVVFTVGDYNFINENAIVPTRGSEYAAGYDLYACIQNELQVIPAGQNRLIGTGLAMEIPEGYVGLLYARSGLATKRGLRPANCVGVIDSDYRGEIMVALHNDNLDTETINSGDRIAQIVIAPYLSVEFEEAKVLNETSRGASGFGSTGTGSMN